MMRTTMALEGLPSQLYVQVICYPFRADFFFFYQPVILALQPLLPPRLPKP